MDKYIIQHEGLILYNLRDHGTPRGTTGGHSGRQRGTACFRVDFLSPLRNRQDASSSRRLGKYA
eukprot:16432748-Heterocapsa_arctica.AAC.1